MSFYSIALKAGVPYKQNAIGTLLLIDSVGTAAGVDVTLINAGGTERTKIPLRVGGFRIVEDFEGVIFTSPTDTNIGVFLSQADVQLGLTAGGGVNVTNSAANPVPVNFAGTVTPVLGNVTVINTPAQAVPVTLHGSDNATPIPVTLPSTVISNTLAQAIPVFLHGSDDATLIPVSLSSTVIANTSAQSIPVTPYQGQTVTDLAQASVTATAAVFAAVDTTRRGLRIKNSGTNPVAIGGATVTFSTAAIVILPGDVWNENEAPAAAWYAVCAATLASTLNLQKIV
jgi:hypothetical protein